MSDEYGIIDIGSNTMRLVIYKRDKSGRLKVIENVKIVVRLRKYLTSEGILAPSGVSVLINTLLSFQEVTRFHKIEDVRCVATATVRQATNQKQIQREVENRTGFNIRILSEYEEAYYGYLAIVNTSAIEDAITIDLGGGSTEVTYFRNRELENYHSFPFGVLSLKNQFISGDIPVEAELERIKQYVQKQFESLKWLKNKQVPVIAMGGSARNLAQIHQALVEYPLSDIHQYEMTKQNIEDVKRSLSPLSFEELQKVEGLSQDRTDIILPAVEVFDRVVTVTKAPTFILSRKGLRDGVFYEEFMKPKGIMMFNNVIEESLLELAEDYEVKEHHAKHLSMIAESIFTQIKNLGLVEVNDKDYFYLKKAAAIYNFGESVYSESSSEHTFYLLTNRMVDGMKHKERIMLALIASYKNKTLFQQFVEPYKEWFSKNELKKIRLLGSILKLAYNLNATKRNIVEKLIISVENESIRMKVFCTKDWRPEEYKAEKQKKHLEKMLKVNIVIQFIKSC